MAGTRFYGLFDQAGMFAPLAGEQAATLRVLPGVVPHALRGRAGYYGNTGWLHPVGVQDAPLATANGYFGVMPSDLQPIIVKPSPWTDPTAGAR